MPTELMKAFEAEFIGYEFPSQALRDGAVNIFGAGWRAAASRYAEEGDMLQRQVATLTAENAALNERVEAVNREFKNFHRLICGVSSYHHDEIDWRRDQASLCEHINTQLKAQLAAAEPTPQFLIENFTRLYGLVDRISAYPRRREDEVSLETFRDEARTLLEIAGPLEKFTAPPQHAAYPDDPTPEMVAAGMAIDWGDADVALSGQIINMWHAMVAKAPKQHAASVPESQSLLRKPGDPLPAGCYCKPGKCVAPVVMGRQMKCRNPEKTAAQAAQEQEKPE